jgi:hypothetical protein
MGKSPYLYANEAVFNGVASGEPPQTQPLAYREGGFLINFHEKKQNLKVSL